MTYKELYETALEKLERSKITLGEFEKMIAPLNAEIATANSDTVSRRAAIEAAIKGADSYYADSIKEEINNVPPAESKRIRGRWIPSSSQCGIRCSECGLPPDDFCYSIDYRKSNHNTTARGRERQQQTV